MELFAVILLAGGAFLAGWFISLRRAGAKEAPGEWAALLPPPNQVYEEGYRQGFLDAQQWSPPAFGLHPLAMPRRHRLPRDRDLHRRLRRRSPVQRLVRRRRTCRGSLWLGSSRASIRNSLYSCLRVRPRSGSTRRDRAGRCRIGSAGLRGLEIDPPR